MASDGTLTAQGAESKASTDDQDEDMASRTRTPRAHAAPKHRQARRRYAVKAQARHDVLEKATEAMLSLIRLHVAGCPPCAKVVCSGGMRDLLDGIDDKVADAVGKAAAEYPLTRDSRHGVPSTHERAAKKRNVRAAPARPSRR